MEVPHNRGKSAAIIRNFFTAAKGAKWWQRLRFLVICACFFTLEFFAFLIIRPAIGFSLLFSLFWSAIFTCLIVLLPPKAGRIVFGLLYFLCWIWCVAQLAYYQVFNKFMWFSTLSYAGEGAVFIGDILLELTKGLWIYTLLFLALGILVLVKYPSLVSITLRKISLTVILTACTAGLVLIPEIIYPRQNTSEGNASYRFTYDTMYSSQKTYALCGFYHMFFRDAGSQIMKSKDSQSTQRSKDKAIIDKFLTNGQITNVNEMTGIFAEKNVILVLMESADDWLITAQDTPTLFRLMQEGINFTNFYTPGYGSARTLNSEFAMNTGIFLPSTGDYVFDYLQNDFRQSMIGQFAKLGYDGYVFHYNNGDFYNREDMEPAFGYQAYISYEEFTQQENDLLNENYPFENAQIRELFFRPGQTFNTIITRAAHLPYTYKDPQAKNGLLLHPEFEGKYPTEAESVARLKVRLIDDMFTVLLSQLERNGKLNDTVIIAMADHYTYGYPDEDALMMLSGVDIPILLERTPCFIWSARGPTMEVTKTLNTTDLLPTILNLWGIGSDCNYLGQDAFDPGYNGYAVFTDGTWISDGVICAMDVDGQVHVLQNKHNKALTDNYLQQMSQMALNYIHVNNLILSSDYYKK